MASRSVLALCLLALFAVSYVSAGCDSSCKGTCKNDKCMCPPGHAGSNCDFSLKTLYKDHAESVYKLRHVRPLDLQGWHAVGPLFNRLLDEVKPNFVIEMGVWKGASSMIMAEYLAKAGHGVLMSIDTWLGSLEFWQYPGPTVDLMWRHGYPSVYYTFISNVIHKNMTDYVIPFPAPSRLAADYLVSKGIMAEFMHVDGGHGYEDVVEDIKLWWPLLAPGGIMMGDDYAPSKWPGVVRAAKEFAEREKLQLYTAEEGDKWWVYKPKDWKPESKKSTDH